MLLRVVSFNIHKSKHSLLPRSIEKEVSDFIQMIDADIVFIQETQCLFAHQERNHLHHVADQMGMNLLYAPNASYKKGHHGNAILSRYPISLIENVNLTVNYFEKRGLLLASLELPDDLSPMSIACTHLNLRHKERLLQYLTIKKTISEKISSETRLILAGDFNDWNQMATTHFASDLSLTEAHSLLMGKYAYTYPAWFPKLPLDRIYFRGLKAVNVEVIKFKLSDHLPLLATFDTAIL